MGEVGVHLHHVARAVIERVAEAREVGRADAFFSLRCSTSTQSCSAARRSAISPVPSGEPSSTTSTRKPSGAAPASTSPAASDDRLDVLGLVVGREDQPRLAGHRSAYPSQQWTCRTPRSPMRSRSSATCTSSTGRSSTACWPTATRPRRCARHPCRSPRWRARAARPSCRGSARRSQEKILDAARDRHDPRGREAAREVPAGPDRDHAAARPRAQARAAAVHRARRSTRPRRCARPRSQQRLRAVRGLGAKFETSVLAALDRMPAHAPAQRPARARAAAARARDRRDARRRPDAQGGERHAGAARRLGPPAWPTASRTST